jgi:hypothetical protein
MVPVGYVVVNILLELASNSARYTGGAAGGKLAIGCHPDTCPISKSGTYRSMDLPARDNQSSYRATSSCMWLLESIIYNFYKSSIGVVATWQELWMLVGHDLNMVNFRLGRGQGGPYLMQFRCL